MLDSSSSSFPEIDTRDTGTHVPQVPVDFFKSSVLPKIEAEELDAIMKDLIEKKIIVTEPLTKKPIRWAGFSSTPSKTKPPDSDNIVFKTMIKIHEAVVESARTVVARFSPGSCLKLQSKARYQSEIEDVDFSPDASAVCYETIDPTCDKNSETIKACDVVYPCEWRKGSSIKDRNSNVAKIISDSTHIFYNDPRRRFTFGITAEGMTIRFWFFCRAHIMVSQSFDFFEKPQHLVHFMASLAFATPEELGYDPTVSRCLVKDEAGIERIGYRFTLANAQQYETVTCLSSSRSRRILGPGTRVWKVRRIKPESEPGPGGKETHYALKDVWRYHDSRTEGQIQADIFKKVNTVNPIPTDEFEEDFAKYFMDIVTDEVVTIDHEQDRTLEMIMRANSLEDVCVPFPLQEVRLTTSSYLPMPWTRWDPVVNAPAVVLTFKPMMHCREVFADVGTPLNRLKDLTILFQALIYTLKGLRYLHSAGYVHRDISPGNLLYISDNGLCKISDLEYAEQYEPKETAQSTKTGKTGTPAFMAVEVQLNRHLHSRPVLQAIHHGPPVAKKDPKHQQKSTSNIPHNYLHDLESLWWIAIWTSLRIVPVDATAEDIKNIQILFLNIFPNSASGSNSRLDFLLGPVSTVEETPQYFTHWAMIQPILVAHRALADHYINFETEAKYFSSQKFSNIYGSFALHFKTAMEAAPSSIAFLDDTPESVKPKEISKKRGIAALPAAADEAPTRQPKRLKHLSVSGGS